MGLGAGHRSLGWSEDWTPQPQLMQKPEGQEVLPLLAGLLWGKSGSDGRDRLINNDGLEKRRLGRSWRQHRPEHQTLGEQGHSASAYWSIVGIRLSDVFVWSQTRSVRSLTRNMHAVGERAMVPRC